MSTVLQEIVAAHRAAAAADERSRTAVEAAVASAPPVRDFAASLLAAGRAAGVVGVIAEVKRRSPSKGELAPGLAPARLAADYERGGACCLSVLTDERYFGGSAEDLRRARAAVSLPVLRKDFTVCDADLYDARAMGADAVLLIVAALSDDELARFLTLGERLDLSVLVEVHDEAECGRALRAGARLVGVNQRDLATFSVDRERALRLAPAIPDEVCRVAESGISTPEDLVRLGEAGYDAVLVGEALVTAADPAAATAALRSPAGSQRAASAPRFG